MISPHYRPASDFRDRVGLLVPTWFPPGHPPAEAARLLTVTLADGEIIAPPSQTVVVLDDTSACAAAVRQVCQDFGHPLVYVAEGHLGKGGAVAHGLARLLETPALEWFVVRDHDGDHWVHDVPRLLRLAAQMRAETGAGSLLVNGGRVRLDRPLGWLRAEYELVVNHLVWRGLLAHAARAGRGVDERWLPAGLAEPDLQSGFKCYSRAAAEVVVEATRQADFPLRRWGCEVLAVVEVIARGGVYGEVLRATLDEQPLTTYEGNADRAAIHGDIILWLSNRLELPAEVALLWLNAALNRGALRSLEGQAAAVEALWRHVAEGLGRPTARRAGPAWAL